MEACKSAVKIGESGRTLGFCLELGVGGSKNEYLQQDPDGISGGERGFT